MQIVLTKYWLAIHVGLLCFASWYGVSQPRGVGHRSLLWLALLALEALVLLPSVRRGETLADARLRVGCALLRDPFLYLGLAVLGMVVIQWLNSGCTLVYLPDADIWQFSRPPVPWLPSSIDPKIAFSRVAISLACVTAGLVLRLGVNRSGKRYLLQAASAFSGIVGFQLVWRASAGTAPYADLASHPPACNAGSFFGFWLLVGMGVYLDALCRRQRGTELLFVLAFVGNLAAMLFFASSWAILAYGIAGMLFAVYWLFFVGLHQTKATQVKLFLATAFVIAGTAVALIYVFPGNPVTEKLGSLASWKESWNTLMAERDTRVTAGLKIWKACPWVGTGGDGFFHYVGTVVDGKGWALLRRDQAYVRNDQLQFLCEYGAFGAGLLLALVIALLIPILYRLRLAWQAGSAVEYESRLLLFRLSPLVVAGILAASLCFAESWLASPLQSPAVLTSWLMVMSTLPAFLPASAGSGSR